MAKKDDIYESDEYKELLDSLNEYKGSINSELGNYSQKMLRDYKEAFNMSKDDLEVLLSTSDEMRDAYEKLSLEMSKISDLIKESGDNIRKLSKHYFISEKEMKKNLDLISNYDQLTRKKQELKDERTSKGIVDPSSPEYKEYEEKIIRLGELAADIEKKLNGGTASKQIFNDYKSKGNSILNEGLKLQNDINDSIQSSGVAVSNVNKELEKSNEILSDNKKILSSISFIGKTIYETAKVGANKWIEVNDRLFKTGRSMGMATSQIIEMQNAAFKNYTDTSAHLGMSLDEIFKFQENYIKSTGRAINLSKEQLTTVAKVGKLVGPESTNEMLKNMDELGASSKTASEYLLLNRIRAQRNGLDAAKSSEIFANNVKLASKYNFKEGVNGISRMVQLSQKFKFNLESVANSMNKFSTIGESIETSANLQVLGGEYAKQFGNPLEVMAMSKLDGEEFVNKIVETFSKYAEFDRKTGQVRMNPIERDRMKYAAQNLGLDFNDVWNMSSRKALMNDIDRYIDKNKNFSEEDKNLIYSKAQYDNGRHKVTYFNNGDEVTKDVSDLTKDDIKYIRGHNTPEISIQNDVSAIRGLLSDYLNKEIDGTKTGKEIISALKEVREMFLANLVNPLLETVRESASYHTRESTPLNLGLTTSLGAFSGTLIGGLGSIYLGKSIKKIFENNANKALNKPRNIHFGKFLSKMKVPKIGKYGLALSAVASTLYLGKKLFFDDDNEKKTKNENNTQNVNENQYYQNQKSEQSINEYHVNSEVKNSNDEQISELRKQTKLLDVISRFSYNPQLGNTSLTSYNTNSVYRPINRNNSYNESNDYSYSSMMPMALYGGSLLLDKSKRYRDFRERVKKKINVEKPIEKPKISSPSVKAKPKFGQKIINGVKKPLGASIAVDLANYGAQSVGLWEEGSHADKLSSIASTALMSAGIGSSFGPIGTGVGAAIGALYGIYDNYGKEINDGINKLLGIESKKEEDKIRYENEKINKTDERFIDTYAKYNNVEPYQVSSDVYNTSQVLSQPYVGEPTYIREDDYYNYSYNTNHSENINLNVNGTLRLASNNKSVDIDMNQLLNNPQFKNQLLDIVYNGLHERGNGSRINKNAKTYIQNGAYDMDTLNGINHNYISI